MELRQLRHFIKVLETGSITRAAHELSIAQPSLSLSMKALERSVGQQLLNRSGSGISATVSGTLFERYARNIVREAEKAQSELDALRGGGLSRLTLGVLTSFSVEFVPQVLSKFLKTTQAVDLEIDSFTGNQDVVIRKLQSADWDLALTLVRDEAVFPSGIEVQRIAPSTSNVYCCISHPLAHKKNVSLEDLATYAWAFTNVGEAENQVAKAFSAVGRRPIVKIRTNSVHQIFTAALDNPLLFLAPELAISNRLLRSEFVAVDQPYVTVSSSMAVLYSNLSERTGSMRTFAALCAKHAKEMTGKK